MKLFKPCKGTSKALGYGCGDEVSVKLRKFGLCNKCYRDWLLNSKEGKDMVISHTLKATKPRRDLQTYKDERKSEGKISNLLINIRYVCHNYIKERDKGKPCVSCGEPWHEGHQAGHWKKAETYSVLRFHENNVHNQCQGCNLMKDGNVQMYSDRITERITLKQKQEIEHIAAESKKGHHKWSKPELIEIREYYKKKMNELK